MSVINGRIHLGSFRSSRLESPQLSTKHRSLTELVPQLPTPYYPPAPSFNSFRGAWMCKKLYGRSARTTGNEILSLHANALHVWISKPAC